MVLWGAGLGAMLSAAYGSVSMLFYTFTEVSNPMEGAA